MKNFPMFLRMSGRRVVICGGGTEAARKTRLVLKTEASIVIVADQLDPELAGLVASGRATHLTQAAPDTFDNCALCFIATGDETADLAFAALARAAGAVVNVVDRPEHCDAFTPSIVDRDPVVVAIGTEGMAPVLGRSIKTDIEVMLDPRLGTFAALAGRLRDAVAERIAPASRRAFWEWAFTGDAFDKHRKGDEHAAADMLKAAIATGAAPENKGRISLVGAGPGARDLLTLRAVRRLQEADVIFYDRLVDPEVLELARRDADRIYVGKEVGAHAWPQDRIDRLIVAEAGKGLRVVRLKSGDPSIFGRAGEEIAAARAAGIEIEIVPGITAASAAAAAMTRPLTERGETDTFVITTGTCRPGDAEPDWTPLARPGTAMAFYMAVDRAAHVEANLLNAGVPGDCTVEVVCSASTRRERRLSTHLSGLAQALERHQMASPAILLVRYSKVQGALSRHRAAVSQGEL
ncbi:uroporphyrinogen-III C-methyltransferase [Pseudooceanicola sediminis]|uniref:Uroporphyrinogen-III C-methyltransferase n=1 Tax=Pseudooceanicola sediminis TaxID=2211117 RepID=A0A399J1G2_9RHOB|nr:siroheme synthase CysG [Pseudooceanicola sediminis]KAA2313103.1 uroporphyrinogen-III C-methyltransferase [Puniceibacterium sp. HSS470]RII37752.1 uroporphyrinogen-III C-methyltransferase [Pseudooceanicola sediminis]|tara:strand:+ start:37088 stop:38482 length:1395 start_codon:yes stop_codon:yes gene_type:complete